MQCPACEENLSRAEYNGQQIAKCGSCNGTWLTGGAFTAVCVMDGSGFSPRDVAKLKILAQYKVEKTIKLTEHPCPRCAKKLKTRNFANIAGFFVEQCPGGCGVWVRDGDIDRIRILRSLGVTEEVKVRKKPEAVKKAAEPQRPMPGRAILAPMPPAETQTAAASAEADAAAASVPPPVAPSRAAAAARNPDTAKTARSKRVEIEDSEDAPRPWFFARIIAALFGRKR